MTVSDLFGVILRPGSGRGRDKRFGVGRRGTGRREGTGGTRVGLEIRGRSDPRRLL